MSDYWKDNGIEKPQAIVVCAACRHGDLVLCGARHWDNVMSRQFMSLSETWTNAPSSFEEGFINQFGEFLTREEAMEVVNQSGQPFNISRNGNDVSLFSEGLY